MILKSRKPAKVTSVELNTASDEAHKKIKKMIEDRYERGQVGATTKTKAINRNYTIVLKALLDGRISIEEYVEGE